VVDILSIDDGSTDKTIEVSKALSVHPKSALLADLMNFNHQLIEPTLEKVRRIELGILKVRDAAN
jgi:hypothetical protein